MVMAIGTDRSLGMEAWLAGDADATFPDVDSLYGHYQAMLARYAARRGAADPEGTADLAFFDGVRAIDQLQNRTEPAFRAYLFRAVASRVASEKRRIRPTLEGLPEAELVCPTASRLEDRMVDATWVDGLLDSLSIDQRDVISYRFYHDYSTREIADRLGKSPGAVRKLQHDAIKRLRRTVFAIGAAVLVLVMALGLLAVRDNRTTMVITPATPTSISPDAGGGGVDGSGGAPQGDGEPGPPVLSGSPGGQLPRPVEAGAGSPAVGGGGAGGPQEPELDLRSPVLAPAAQLGPNQTDPDPDAGPTEPGGPGGSGASGGPGASPGPPGQSAGGSDRGGGGGGGADPDPDSDLDPDPDSDDDEDHDDEHDGDGDDPDRD